MKKQYVLAFLLIAIALATTIVEIKGQTNQSIATLTVNTDQSNPVTFPYDVYSQITLNETLAYNNFLTVSYPTDGLVGVQIQDPNGQNIVIRTLSTDSSIIYGLAANVKTAYLCDGSENQISTISIPSSTNPVIPTAYFSVGNNLNSPQSVIVTLSIYDSNGVPFPPVSVATTLGSLSSSEGQIDFTIPSWAHYGTAFAYLNVYNTWPSKGGVPLAEEKAFQFTISGGTPFQGTPPTTYSLNGLYHNFNMTFRLPKYATTGTYTAYSSVNYQGVTSSQTTPFAVALLADVNGDGVVDFNDISAFVTMYIAYYANHVYSPQIDYLHTGTINFNDISLFVTYYIECWSS
jgi:hypothetical protein